MNPLRLRTSEKRGNASDRTEEKKSENSFLCAATDRGKERNMYAREEVTTQLVWQGETFYTKKILDTI